MGADGGAVVRGVARDAAPGSDVLWAGEGAGAGAGAGAPPRCLLNFPPPCCQQKRDPDVCVTERLH